MNVALEVASKKVSHLALGSWDRTFPASRLEFLDFDGLMVEDTAYGMLPSAKRLIAKRFRVPSGYLERCPTDLQAGNLNKWLARLGDIPIFCRFKDEKIRAFFSPVYKPIDNTEIMTRITESYPPETSVELWLSNEMMVLNIPDYRQTFDIKGDNIAPGINFVNSEVGQAAYSCGIFYQRLARPAGLIAIDAVAARTRHSKNNALEGFETTLAKARRLALHNHLGKIGICLQKTLRNPRSGIVSFGKRFRLSNNDIRSIQRSWEEEPGHSLWHIIQAFARLAAGEYLAVEKAYRLQRIAGWILANVG